MPSLVCRLDCSIVRSYFLLLILSIQFIQCSTFEGLTNIDRDGFWDAEYIL